MRISRLSPFLIAAVLSLPAIGRAEPMNLYSFKTTAEFLKECGGGGAPPSDCTAALAHVEEVVDNGGNPNETCDGGPEAMLKATTNKEMEDWLMERVLSVVAWLRNHPEYADQSYGDGIWAALKGVYCR